MYILLILIADAARAKHEEILNFTIQMFKHIPCWFALISWRSSMALAKQKGIINFDQKYARKFLAVWFPSCTTQAWLEKTSRNNIIFQTYVWTNFLLFCSPHTCSSRKARLVQKSRNNRFCETNVIKNVISLCKYDSNF